jgi:hypothetical protein
VFLRLVERRPKGWAVGHSRLGPCVLPVEEVEASTYPECHLRMDSTGLEFHPSALPEALRFFRSYAVIHVATLLGYESALAMQGVSGR